MSIVPSYEKTLERTSAKDGTYYELQDIQEFITECYTEGADKHTHVSLKGKLSLEIENA